VSATLTHFQRLGYSFDMPEGWRFEEGYVDWEVTGGPPRVGLPAFDDFLSPESDPRILVGERPVRDSAPLDQWIAQMRAAKAITYPVGNCNPAEEEAPFTLGGEPAQMVAFHCPSDGADAGIVQLLARHADNGWIVSCFSSTGAAGGLPNLERQCGRWLRSFQFEP
jgi:hypothetical protein